MTEKDKGENCDDSLLIYFLNVRFMTNEKIQRDKTFYARKHSDFFEVYESSLTIRNMAFSRIVDAFPAGILRFEFKRSKMRNLCAESLVHFGPNTGKLFLKRIP